MTLMDKPQKIPEEADRGKGVFIPPDLDDMIQTTHELEEQRDRDRETIKTMQKEIDGLKKEIEALELLANNKEEERRATREDFDRLVEKTEMLQEALKKSSFASASAAMPSTAARDIWLPAIDAIKLFIPLRKARDHAVDKHQPWRKIKFEIKEDGRVYDARLEEIGGQED